MFGIKKVIMERSDPMELILTNGKKITYYHNQECSESVWAAFDEIDDLAYTYLLEEPLVFESVAGYGFRFGNPGRMISVPCYDAQNGWYNDSLTIYYDGVEVLGEFECGKKYIPC